VTNCNIKHISYELKIIFSYDISCWLWGTAGPSSCILQSSKYGSGVRGRPISDRDSTIRSINMNEKKNVNKRQKVSHGEMGSSGGPFGGNLNSKNLIKKSTNASKDISYKQLLEMIKPIIPNVYNNVSSRSEKDPNYEIIRGILATTKDIFNKIDDPKRQAELRNIYHKGSSLLTAPQKNKGFRSSPNQHIPDEERDALLKQFSEALKSPDEEFNPMAKAPFSKLGEDDFEDVDHQILAMEIKKLALTLKEYLQIRVKEGQSKKPFRDNGNEFLSQTNYYTDSVLAQMTLELAKLHRAVLRNHHHLLMLIGNFAGNAANIAPEKQNNNTKSISIGEKYHA